MRAVSSVLGEIVIDCENPRRVAEFWSKVLGWPDGVAEEGYVWVSSTGAPDAPRPVLVFAEVPEKKTLKNRVHIDVNPHGCDQQQELERLLALGARHVDIGQGDAPWYVLADPEGNEFCLLRRRID
ncbi:MAG: VOC family protein [Candidatus Dormibacteria bacterium]